MASDRVTWPYPPFDFGTAVRWRRPAGPDLEGSICGFREIDNAKSAEQVGLPQGTVLVLVELASGEATEVPLNELEPI